MDIHSALRASVLTLILAIPAAPVAARPLITEEVAPLGRLMFEAEFSATYRMDEFTSPDSEYETVTLPVEFNLGITDRLQGGFMLNYLSHRLQTPDTHYKGSRTSLFSPQIKYSPWDRFGVQLLYHTPASEEGDQELQIARGDDLEVNALFNLPFRLPVELNIGYLFRHSYTSNLGIRGGQKYTVRPGDIFQASLAVEIPIRWGLALLTEGAFYSVDDQSVAGLTTVDSAGEAADALIGLTWVRGGWSLGTGVAFGLLDESHTSFNLERGAGDYQFHWSASYRLQPRKPEQ